MHGSEMLCKQSKARLCYRFIMSLRLLSIQHLPAKLMMSTTTRLPIYLASPLNQRHYNTRLENGN
jgi:hypothetical protein